MSIEQTGIGPQINNPTNLPLLSEEKHILKIMFASYQRVTIKQEFTGGLSGGRVFLVRPIKSERSPDLPAVVKIAPTGLIRREWQAYQDHVHKRLPSIAEITDKPVLPPDGLWGGLRYTLIGEGGIFEIESLYKYCRRASIANIRYVLEERLFAIAGPNWWQFNEARADWPVRASYDFLLPVNLLIEPAIPPPDVTPHLLKPDAFLGQSLSQGDYVRLEGFVVTEVDLQHKAVTLNVPPHKHSPFTSYRLRLQPVKLDSYRVDDEIAPVEGKVRETRLDRLRDIVCDALEHRFDLTTNILTAPDGTTLLNPLTALPILLGKTRNIRESCIHGDLNMENILVEPVGRNVSLIDFATARRDHALHDLLRLETEVITKLLPEALGGTRLLVKAIDTFYKRLHKVTFAPKQPISTQPHKADLEKPFEMLVTIREMARQCLFDPNDWTEYYEGLTLYVLGALKFKNLDRFSKEVAFWIAAVACSFIEPVSATDVPINKDWSRLQKYLPAAMYQEQDKTTCLAHLNALLRAVLTYLPRHLALDLLRKPVVAQEKGQFLQGTLLLADISGFTAMSEKLRKRGEREGAEEIARVINEYLDVMLAILFKYNGRLVKFGGDAMSCLFTGTGQGAMNAVWAAWEMKQALADRFAEIEVFQKVYSLEMKVGSNSGLLFAASVGTAEHMEYVLTGSAVRVAVHAESAADKGDILVSHETYALVKECLEAEELAGKPDFYRIISIRSEPVSETEDPWREIEEYLSIIENDLWEVVDRLDALSPYLPAEVLPQLVYDPQGGQIEGQHRQVTVLFANFMGMSKVIHARGSKDEAGIATDLGEYFEAMQEEIQYYGGVINKVDLYDQGDKLMVLFGAPMAHERDAQRAALTALAMQEAMIRLSAPAAAAFLTQCIGIHTGFVFAGNVGASKHNRREYTVMGGTVNLAARLMSAAQPGQVWVSQSVWDQIQSEFEATALPPVRAKGISDTITAYKLQGTRGVQGRIRSRVLDSDIVGREAELDVLEECFDDLFSVGEKQIVAITGPAGVGKTRLVTEWQRRVSELATSVPGAQPTCPGGRCQGLAPARSAGEKGSRHIGEEVVTWSSGRGHSYGQKTHGVLIEILEGLLAFAEDDSQETRWSKLSAGVREGFADAEPGWFGEFSNRLTYLGWFLALDLSKRQGLTERAAGLEAETLQLQTRLAVCDLLSHAARKRPLILVLEDLHWADEASLDMLKFVIDQVSDDVPILFCLVFRQRRERPVWATWQEIERFYPNCHSISLKELMVADGRQLLSNLLETEQLSEDFQALVLHEADGNPLYVEEILHALIEEGTIVQSEGGWRITRDIEGIRVPDTLYQIIQSRVDELDFGSPGARRVLWMASVIGEQFTHDLLQDLFISTGRRREELRRHLDELRKADMIQRVRTQRGVAAPPGRSQRVYRFRHGLVQQVAYENMLIAKRREYHCEVGRRLEAQHSEDLQRYYDTLAYHYDRGKEWEKAFQYHWLTGQRDAQAFANQDGIFHLQRALEIADYVTSDVDTLAQAHCELGKVLATVAEFDDALEHLTKAWILFEEVPGETTLLHRARVGYHIGRVYERKGGAENLESALEWQGKGLALLPETPTAEAALLHALEGLVRHRQGDFEQAVKAGEQARALAQVAGDMPELGTVHRLLSMVWRAQGRPALALEHCQMGIEADRELPNLVALGRDYMNRGVIALDMGDWQLAKESDLEAIALLERAGAKYQLAMTCCNLADKYRCMGDLAQGLEYAWRGLDIFLKIESHQAIIFAHAVLACLFWRQGELDQARTQLLGARELVEKNNAVQFKPAIARWLAQVYLTEGDLTQAEVEIQPLLSLEERDLGVEFEPVQRLWGQILAARGRMDEALQVLQESLKRLEQSPMRYQTASTLLALANMLAQREGKAAEARPYAERARAVLADLGARLDLQEVDELLARIE